MNNRFVKTVMPHLMLMLEVRRSAAGVKKKNTLLSLQLVR